MKNASMFIALLGLIIFFNGCATPPQPSITVSRTPKVISLDIDPRDYNEIAKEFYESLISSRRIPNGKVIALGPVIESMDRGYRFDARLLQEKIMTVAMKNGRFNFSFAVDAIGDNNAAEARYNIMSLQFEKEYSVDPEELITFGTLSNIDYLVFGRLSTHTTNRGPTTEVTYTYSWKIGDCRTGLLVWADEVEITKSNHIKED